MPQMQVYLPDDLHAQAKARGLPVSRLLQDAIRAEIRRQDVLAEGDRHLADLLDEVGEPTPEEHAQAEAVARHLRALATHTSGVAVERV